jgi:LytS/YehU family sensor histidine kinase
MQLQKENTEAGLSLLKAQIHPHFLFNTLNNIYSFTQNTSAEASGMITRLSSLLRYTLYEGNQALVPLQKELQMVQDYIDIEKIRYGNQMELHIDLPERTTNYYIAPLLLLPLVENCFKHGTSQMLEQPWVHLWADIVNDQLHVKLLNGKVNEETNEAPLSGIGIRNVKERLLLLYPDKHELHITSEEEVFIVNLKIELTVKKEVLTKKDKPAYA